MAEALNDIVTPGVGDALDLLLGPDGDVAFMAGDLVLARGDVAVGQEASIRCQFWLGSWFLDLSAGVDFEGQVLTKPADPVGAAAAFRAELLRTTRVRAVESAVVELDSATRRLSLDYVISTLGGSTVSGALEV